MLLLLLVRLLHWRWCPVSRCHRRHLLLLRMVVQLVVVAVNPGAIWQLIEDWIIELVVRHRAKVRWQQWRVDHKPALAFTCSQVLGVVFDVEEG
jgi:hypothetical protein